MTLAFRPKSSRRVRLMAPEGTPIPGAEIDVSMFWSDRNHCGVLAGREPLGTQVTDPDGWIEVPDGDFEYALTLGRGLHNHVFAESRSIRSRLVTFLTEPTTEVVVRELPVRPLEMRVRRGDEPAVGVDLYVYLDDCCGACSGPPVATTDEEGRIRLDWFRPERYYWIWLEDEGGELWRSEVASLPEGIVEVQLPAPAASDEGGLEP